MTSDIAAEGVNLHKQCHHLIHVDLPWSLITLEQRNGRIDRYGQLHSPEIRYLVYQPADEEIASDMRIVSRLIAKEHAAHRALGDVASVMGLYSESEEEDQVREALRKRTAAEREQALEDAAPEPVGFDPWAFAGLASPGAEQPSTAAGDRSRPGSGRSGPVALRRRRRLSQPPCSSRFRTRKAAIGWETDGPIVSFKPPDDLLRRFNVLPQSYLRQRNLAERLRADRRRASSESIARRRRRPASDHRGDGDSVAGDPPPRPPASRARVDRRQAALPRRSATRRSRSACDVADPVLLVSGVWSNKLGEPIAADVARRHGRGRLGHVRGHARRPRPRRRAGPDGQPRMDGDLDHLRTLVPPVVTAAQRHAWLTTCWDQLATVTGGSTPRVAGSRPGRHGARGIAAEMKSEPHQRRRVQDIDRISRQISGLIADHTPADAPLVRIVGALVPSGRGTS